MTFADGYKLGEVVNISEAKKKILKALKKQKHTRGKNKNENKLRFN